MKLEYMPIVSDPTRRPVLQAETGEQEGTPMMDFVMSLSGYMELMAAGAALLLVAQLATAL